MIINKMADDENVEINSKNSKIISEYENVLENVSTKEYEEEISVKISETEDTVIVDVLKKDDDTENRKDNIEPQNDEINQILIKNEEGSKIEQTFLEVNPVEITRESLVNDQQYDDDENEIKIESEVTSEMLNSFMSFAFSTSSDEIESPNNSLLEIVSENDKEKLLDLYRDLIVQKKSGATRNRTLNNALSEFMQSKEPIVFQEVPGVDIVSLKKYNEALERLYKVNQRRDIVLETERVESEILLAEKNIIFDVAIQRRDKLTDILYNTGTTLLSSQTGLPLSEKFVSKLIARFLKTQSDLSEARLDFIIIQNFLTEIKARLSELDNLDDGLKVIDYESRLSEVQGLQVVIESKNEELDRLRQRSFIDTHKIVHLGEKYSQLLWTFEQQKLILNSRKMKEQNLRKVLSKIKKDKDGLRAQQNNLIQQAGLLNKTALMKDYDNVIYQVSFISSLENHFLQQFKYI